ANPFNGLTGAGTYLSSPALVDIDGDGDFDLDLGSYGGHRFFENTGTALAPAFTERTGAANPFGGVYSTTSRSTFVDIDGDGDLDAVVGGTFGPAVYRNTTTVGQPVTVSIQSDLPTINGLAPTLYIAENGGFQQPGIDVTVTDALGGIPNGSLTVTGLLTEDSVTIVDQGMGAGQIGFDSGTGDITWGGVLIGQATGGLNGADLVISFNGAADAAAVEALIEDLAFADGRTDPTQSRMITLLLANAGGEVIGDDLAFQGQISRIATIGFIDVDFPAPALGDLDGDGDLDMVIGDSHGQIHLFRNVGTTEAALFSEELIAPYFGLPYSSAGYVSPALGDLDGDGDLDMVVGDDDGNLRAYENTRAGAAGPYFEEMTGGGDPFGGATTASVGGVSIVDIDGDGLRDVVVGAVTGALRYFLNTGTAGAAIFTEQTGGANPFDGVTGSGYVAPAFADIDGDGDFDLFLGDYGLGQYFENTGTATAPVFTLAPNILTDGASGFVQRGTFGDLDGDGDIDLVTAGGQYLTLYTQDTRGVSFELFINITLSPATLGLADNDLTFAENTVNAAPQLMLIGATFDDPDGSQDGGILAVTGVLADETISIRNQGAGAGQIGYDDVTGDVTYGGVLIGNFCGCSGGDVALLFTASVTNDAIQAVLNNLTYQNLSNSPVATHDLSIAFIDGQGVPMAAPALVSFFEINGLFDGIDLGADSAPRMIFLPGDNDPDFLVSNAAGGITAFLNDGSGWDQADPVDNPLTDANVGAGPWLPIDLDSDGDLDLVVLSSGGILRSYENQSGVFFAGGPVNSDALDGLDVGVGAHSLNFLDTNNDSSYELVIGQADGSVSLFTFDLNTFELVEQAGAANPFDAIDVGTNAMVAFGDVDNDGDYDLVIGAGDGTLHYFEGVAGAYVEHTGTNDPFAGIDVGDNAAPMLIDGDQDGFDDLLIVGAADGTVHSFGNFTVNAVTVTIKVTAEPDLADDSFAILESQALSGDVSADNGAGADDDDGDVTLINGLAFTAGVPITLPSGARLTMNADGTFSYNPGGAWDRLAGPLSGASNTVGTESFTYTTAGGLTATARITITGVDSNKDQLQGTPGDDIIDGGLGNDTALGGAGLDDLSGGDGNDSLFGGDDNDLVTGGDGADKLYGDDGDDTLAGGAGADRFDGGAGSDTLDGGDANDYLDGGLSADGMAGGLGNDVYIVDDPGDTTSEAGGEGYDIVRTALTWTVADNIEGLELQGGGNVSGTGNAGANNLQGNSGANSLSGLAGVDTINGNDGDDVIIGGEGNDLLRGGLGADTFVVAHTFGSVLETDQVYDFSAAENDIIDLSQIDAIAGGADDAFTLVSAFNKHAGQMTLTFAAGITTLKLDINGDAKVDYQMKINGDVTGESGDWLL
ncbi:MAG: Cyclolysin, partial [Caulobacter sp.]|nr:Cyclolysin [Caulobacter sp.]